MTAAVEPIRQFVEYARTLKGDEKGEAQVFCDRLFQAFGHGGYKGSQPHLSRNPTVRDSAAVNLG
jgi:hypothetical protein